MKKLIIFFLLIAIPLLILANTSFFGFHKQTLSNNPQLNNDRAYRMMQHTMQSWNELGNVWENDMRYSYHYPADNPTHPDSVTVLIWDTESNSFRRAGVSNITYNASGELITHIVSTYNFGTVTLTFQDVTFSYSPEGYLIAYQYKMINMSTMQLDPFARMTIEYVSGSNYSAWNWESEDDITGLPQWTHMTFNWDSNGRIIQETSQISPDSVSWTNSEQLTRTYHPSDTSTGADFLYNMSHQLPIAMIGGDANPYFGKALEELDKSWSGLVWVNDNKVNYDYTGENNTLMNIYSYYWQDSDWSYSENQEFFYDNNGNVSEMDNSHWSTGGWVPDGKDFYDWSFTSANEDNVVAPQTLNLRVYPNPFAENLSLTTDSKSVAPIHISVYNIKGELVKTALSKSNSKVSIKTTDLPTGLYLVKAKQGNATNIIKTLKVK